MEREARDVRLGSCPFDFVSAARHLLVCFIYIYIFHVDPCISWQHRVSADTESDHAHVVCEVDLLQGESLWLSEAFHIGGS